MSNSIKPKRPIISLILSVLLLLKLFSGLSFALNASGAIQLGVYAQLIIILYLVCSINTRGGGKGKCKLAAILLAVLIISDVSLLLFMFNGLNVPTLIYPRLIGAELTYFITLLYVVFSKKQRAYKEYSNEIKPA